uniref:Mediator of RNA polymerase II transcription subunit 7 n=2 Tax=Caenorhabditis tropicalis TaxID=1561998 RepID=A0A1I7U7X1_9PELO
MIFHNKKNERLIIGTVFNRRLNSSFTMPNSSNPSDSTSDSAEKVILPPVGPVGHKKTIQPIGDSKTIDKEKLSEWMNPIGKLYGSNDIRETVMNLHFQLIPAIETLNKISNTSNEKLKEEVNILIRDFTLLAVFCEKMLDKMEKPIDLINSEVLPDNEKKQIPEKRD